MFSDSSIEIVSDTHDQMIVMVGQNAGFIIQRMEGKFPIERFSLEEESRGLVTGTKGHIAVVGQFQNTPMGTLLVATVLTLVIQAINLTQSMRCVVWAPSGLVSSPQDWTRSCNSFIRSQTNPIQLWINFYARSESSMIEAATDGMIDMFGQDEIEIWDSPRDDAETLDLLECAVLDTILKGSLLNGPKQWVTKTGVLYRLHRGASRLCKRKKVVVLIEQ